MDDWELTSEAAASNFSDAVLAAGLATKVAQNKEDLRERGDVEDLASLVSLNPLAMGAKKGAKHSPHMDDWEVPTRRPGEAGGDDEELAGTLPALSTISSNSNLERGMSDGDGL